MRFAKVIFPAVAVGAATLGTLLAGTGTSALAQPAAPASSTLAQLSITGVPQLGVPAFHGTLGAETATGPVQTSIWPGTDPDGVLTHVRGWYGAPAGPGTSSASVNDPVGARDAETAWAGIGFRLTGPNIISLGAVHTYARCTQPPLPVTAQAYAATDSNSVYLFDDVRRPVAEGTHDYPVTGAQLGLPQAGTGTLTITVAHVQSVAGATANAEVRISVMADLDDTTGNPLYRGPLMDLTIGSVAVTCEPAITTTTPPPTTTSPTTTSPTTTAPTTTAPTTTTPAPTSSSTTTEPPTTTPPVTTPPPTTTTSGSTSQPGTTAPAVGTPGSGGGSGGQLASTGSDLALPFGAGTALIAAGALLTSLASAHRRRR